MNASASRGTEFRDDLRPLAARPGAHNAAARRALPAAELEPLTRLDARRSVQAVAGSLVSIAAVLAFGAAVWPSWWVVLAVLVIGRQQQALFVLVHEAAHYRLFASRGWNDLVGRALGIAGGVSMCTYRVTHRLHHNHLYGDEDPDTALHGGYPRGVAYLWRKLAQDVVGWNAWKTFAYFFGSPALNTETNRASRPLDDTSPELRSAARRDRWAVVAFHAGAPMLAFACGGSRGLALYGVLWALPLVTVLQPILRLRAICEHGAVTDLSSPLTAARTNRTWGSLANRLLGWLMFPHHVNYHVEHHLYPAVPHYHLPALHRLLAEKGALEGAEVRDLRETLSRVFAPKRSTREATT